MDIFESGRFDLEAVRGIAGDRAFEAGRLRHAGGHVQILVADERRVVAQVGGADCFRAVVAGSGADIGGECSCAAHDGWKFCEHMVAAALAANAEDCVSGDGTIERISAYLRSRGVDALAAMILGMAEKDLALFARLDMAAALHRADEETLPARLREILDKVTHIRDYLECSDVPNWAAEVDSILDAISGLAGDGNVALALDLAWNAIGRIGQAMDWIDDPDGCCHALMERARDIHLAAAKTAGLDPRMLARNLFRAELEDRHGLFVGSAGLYSDALKQEGLDEFRRLAREAWDKLPVKTGQSGKPVAFDHTMSRLEAMLDFFAERDGDVGFRIALRTRDLSSCWRYLRLVEFCLSQGCEADALHWAQEGVRVFEDGRLDENLVLVTAHLLAGCGRENEAAELLRRAFTRAPSQELYQGWMKLGGSGVLENAVGILEALLAASNSGGLADQHPSGLLFRIFVRDKEMNKAWDLVGRYKAPRSGTELARTRETAPGSVTVAGALPQPGEERTRAVYPGNKEGPAEATGTSSLPGGKGTHKTG